MTSLVQSVDWLAIAPPALTAVLGVAILIADLFLPDHRKQLLGWIAAAGLAVAALLLLPLRHGDRSTFCLTTDSSLCSYVVDSFTLVMQLLVFGGALLTALLSIGTVREAGPHRGEFWFLLMSAVAGAALLPAARDFVTLIVALEVASLPAYALVGLRRGDRLSSESALKFFISSVTATAVTLLGISFVYGVTGQVHLTAVAGGLEGADARFDTLAMAGVALTLVGFAFKTAAVPFHFWVPDTYVGAPLPVAAYLSVIGKAVGFSGLILVTVIAFPGHSDLWGPAIAVLAALTMTGGNLAALRQRPDGAHSAVRLLAWSSVGQAGYLLVPIAAAAYVDEPGRAIGATIGYALMYAVVNLGAFGVVIHVAHGSRAVRGSQPVDAGQPVRASQLAHGTDVRITDHRGLYAAHPLTALALGFFLLCLAGLPPGIIGLFAKVTVFTAAVDAGLGWLAVVMAANVVIALYYYLQWTAVLFRPVRSAGDLTGPVPAKAPAARPGLGGLSWLAATDARSTAIALATVAAIALSGAPQLVLRFTADALL